ncbi:hypothetical protein DSO57_1015306 [Entomophthora muscae]|uniref:Uncharacterized protein n=1 Tax=Entomophthora muscae TaxID=34485 RepID=A0ACC2TFR1_9FUNG|nr:hypothetical protein DSO57_1015306 [Entomophthora muscae]
MSPQNSQNHSVPKSALKEIHISTHLDFINNLPVHTMNEWCALGLKLARPLHTRSPFIQRRAKAECSVIIEDIVYSRASCRVHPWHLHGHSFHVVARGKSFYNPEHDQKKINAFLKRHPKSILRDTFSLYTTDLTDESNFDGQTQPADSGLNGTGKAKPGFDLCGWYAIRFKADNPGSWVLHWHITHVIMGMATAISVHPY